MTPRASLPMYDLPWLSDAHDRLWSLIAAALRSRGWDAADIPEALAHDPDVHALWREPGLFLSQSCGWPLVDELRGRVTTVGAFVYDVPAAVGPTYRSNIVMRAGSRLPTASSAAMTTAAVNSFDSLSGWISLVRTFPLDGVWPGRVVQTGSHAASIAAIMAGEAHLAAIDSVTWELFRRHDPASIDGLVIVGEGPRIPCLPLVAASGLGEDRLGELRAAITQAVDAPEGRPARDALLITAFVPRDYSDYEPVISLRSHLASG